MPLFRDKRLILTVTAFISSFEMTHLMSQFKMCICPEDDLPSVQINDV